MSENRPWPCPECGSTDTVRDEKDGYLRRCLSCGCRKAFEAFSAYVRTSDELPPADACEITIANAHHYEPEIQRLRDEVDRLRDFVLSLPLTRDQYAEFRKIESYAVRRVASSQGD